MAMHSRHPRTARECFLALTTVLLLTLASTASAAAAEAAARVFVTVGTVEAVASDGSVRALGRGDAVFAGDTLRTGPRGRAQFRFTDGARLALRPDTELAVDDYEHEATAPPASLRTALRLERGGFRAITGDVAQRARSAYRVSTPFAVVGVRGTDYSAVIADLGSGPQLYVGVRSGGIFAENAAGRVDLGLGAPFSFAVVPDFDTLPEGLPAPPTLLLELFGIDLGGGPDDPGGAGGPGAAGGPDASGGGDEDLVVYRLVRRCL